MDLYLCPIILRTCVHIIIISKQLSHNGVSVFRRRYIQVAQAFRITIYLFMYIYIYIYYYFKQQLAIGAHT